MKLRDCLIQASLASRLGQSEYAAVLCRAVLEFFPHHLRAHTILGQVLLDTGHLSEAGDHFEAILTCDPENIVARSGLAVVMEKQGQLRRAIRELQRAFEVSPGNTEVREMLLSFRSQLERTKKDLDITPAAASRVLLRRGQFADAAKTCAEALLTTSDRVDIMLCRAEALWRMGRKAEAAQACRDILRRYPSVIKAKLILATTLLQSGKAVEGASVLHEGLATDPSGMVARPILRDAGLSVPDAEEMIDLPGVVFTPPYEVKAALSTGLSLDLDEEPAQEDLPLLEAKNGNGTPTENLSESFLEVVETVSQVVAGAKQAKGNPRTKGLYLIVSSQANLIKKYGRDKMNVVDKKLRLLAETLGKEGYASHLLYVDVPEALASWGLSPVNPRSPEAIRSLLNQFESKATGQMTKSRFVLLVGGDEILPFHRLANPTDDDDTIVLSDAPYAARDLNYYAPVRAVGRLPDEESHSPALLFHLIDSLVARHGAGNGHSGPEILLNLVPTLSFAKRNGKLKSFGYSALVWRLATEAVYEAIGDVKSLKISPPTTDRGLEARWFDGSRVSLFNLHGAENSPFWYGQKDATYPADYPLFPVALSPDVLKTASTPASIIISEACYGANIIKKTANDSLALQFLKSGAACVIGSTKVAYGSGEPPLMGADLIAKLIWQQVASGLPIGEALVKARTTFVREVQKRQGYLDGDDQKTVLEFILLGDPTFELGGSRPLAKDVADGECEDPDYCPSLYCQRKAEGKEEVRASGEVMAKIRRFMQKAAPDIFDNQLSVLPREVCLSSKQKICQGSCLSREDRRTHVNTYLVTTKRAILSADGAQIQRVARVTVDHHGSILKLAVSK